MDPDADQTAAAFPDDQPSAFGDVDKTASLNSQVQGSFDQMRQRRNLIEAVASQARGGRRVDPRQYRTSISGGS